MSDEPEQQKIRDLLATWLRATAAGDLKTVLTLMAEDVVFLLPGRPPLTGKSAFALAAAPHQGKFRFAGQSEIQEIQIFGPLAYCWSYLTVTVTPVNDGSTLTQAGHVLSIFRREPDGRWLLLRDANLLTPV